MKGGEGRGVSSVVILPLVFFSLCVYCYEYFNVRIYSGTAGDDLLVRL